MSRMDQITVYLNPRVRETIGRLSLATGVPQASMIRDWIDYCLDVECRARLGVGIAELLELERDDLELMRRRCVVSGGRLEGADGL